MAHFESSGIPEDQIENHDEFSAIINSLQCCVCLDVVKAPVECSTCESLYCGDCWEMMERAGKKCAMGCTTPIVKANSFVYSILEKLRITCGNCEKTGLSYSQYVKHIELCSLSSKFSKLEELEEVLNNKREEIQKLKTKLSELKNNTYQSVSQIMPGYSKEELKKRLITKRLNVNQKMELYSATVDGRINDFKNLVLNKGYPILEEVSAKDYSWTSLHYAMHYGKWEIIKFILDYMNQKGELLNTMKLESNDKRCPLACLLKSNSLKYEIKKNILINLVNSYNLEFSPEIVKELKNRNLDFILRRK